MNTNVINTLIENPSVLLLTFFAEPLASVAFAYWLVWLVMRPKSNGGIHTPFSWHLYGIATSLLGSAIFRLIAIATFAGRDAYTGDKTFYYLLIVPAIIAGLYIYWLKQETLKKSTNADWKETKPQNTSEENKSIPPSRIYETEKTESIPSSYIYEIIAEEMDRKEYKKGLMTRAFAEANGDKELAKSLYIKFRYAELFSEMELERKEKQRQQQMEVDRIERDCAEKQQEQQIPTKDGMAFGICSKDWAAIGISSVVAVGFIWISLISSTHTANTPPATVTSVSAQSVPQAVTEDPNCIGDCINGQGKYTYANGETYSGDFKNGIREGHGTYIYADGSKYVGEFKNGDPVESTTVSTTAPPQSETQATKQNIIQHADDLYKQSRYAEALPLYQYLAEQNDAVGQFKLGFMYQNGYGVVKDYQKAVEWLRKSAEQGNAWGQFNLGTMYESGDGVVQDYQKAVEWYRKAAEQGNSWGQYALGAMYQNNKGVTQNYSQAKYWYRKAAEQGNAVAIAALKELTPNSQQPNTQATPQAETSCIGDCINGHGSFTYANGDKYVGEWKNGKREGKGAYTFSNGLVINRVWKDDKEVKDGYYKG
jgi:TPR repeat protein